MTNRLIQDRVISRLVDNRLEEVKQSEIARGDRDRSTHQTVKVT